MRSHPDIAWVSSKKETLWFNGDTPRSTQCDNSLEEYLVHAAAQRLEANRTDLVVGDWSATHFSCVCCPLVFKALNPATKIIIVLRDPIQRAISRFLEQKSLTWAPLHSQVHNHTFASWVQHEMTVLDMCLARTARYRARPGGANRPVPLLRGAAEGLARRPVAGGSGGGGSGSGYQAANGPVLFAAGWGAGMGLATWMEAQCYERSNIVGWSVYPVFLENYMSHFPLSQILVLWTEELAADPLASIRRVERHLGLRPAAYNSTLLSTVFNSRGCYAWNCARHSKDASTASAVLEAAAAVGGAAAQSPFTRAVARLVNFYRPHVRQLVRWAEEGRIPPLPASWRETYGV